MASEYATGFKPDELPEDQREHRKALGGERDGYSAGFHSPEESLYDEAEGVGGKVVDLRSGRPIATTTETDPEIIKRLGALESEGPLPPLPAENDAAAKWLAEHENPDRHDQQKAA
jgi:hypothetical protein